MNIKTIDVNAKEWFDKVNGNSYFSGRITLNYGMKNEKTLLMPFQYGYGDQYEWETSSTLKKNGFFPENSDKTCLSIFCRKNFIILRTSKEKNCKKRDVVSWGE
jgi:hypothetical protein